MTSGSGRGSDVDRRFMRRALALARRGLGRTSPNPPVGAVVVAGGRIAGSGHHPRAGLPHAEVYALEQAGARARGATLYVTLEPCSHRGDGKRTPPCVDRILATGIRRVVAATLDPNPRVSGRGIARLAAAGLDVSVGVLEPAARELIEPFACHVRRGIPLVTLKLALSLDGRLCAPDGTSRWITGEDARRRVHRMRDETDAVMVGIGTALADDPELTVRRPAGRGRDPVRVVVDSRARLPLGSRLVRHRPGAPTVVAVTPDAPARRVRALAAAGVEVVTGRACAGRVDLEDLIVRLGERGVCSVLVEGGRRLATAMLAGGLVDRVVAFVAPRLLGGRRPGSTSLGDLGVATMSGAREMSDVAWTRVGRDIMMEGRLARTPARARRP
jgi:diaminohydroxyphosphoribosylaminopyrimidine deaminase/5-amino-6-(5-phosphoribosylamino)uracil reductase